MKNIRKITIISLLTVFFVAILTSLCIILVQADMAFASQVEMQAYQISHQYDDELKNLTHIPTADEDFDDDEITIILDCRHSGTELKNSVYNFDEVVAELGKIDNIDINSIEELFCTKENEIVSATYRRMLSLKIETPGKNNVIAAIEQLEKLDMVLSAEPQYNYTFVEEWVPSDTFYPMQWGLNGGNGINTEAAWDISKGSGVKVGLFESGIDASHEDLKGRVGQGNFTPAAGTDLSHGTHVGGIISAVSDDKGIAGISQATLYLLNRNTFEESLSFAADNDIRIINASFRFGSTNSQASHKQAIENYGSEGGLLICSAGNATTDTDNNFHYPSGYGDSRLFPDVKNVISVGAIDSNGDRRQTSNYGANSVHIYAPGGDIYSTLPGNGYGIKSGTSMAAPHVTGVAALLLSKEPTLTAAQLKEIILNNADDITISTPDGSQNVKKLNAYKALISLEQDSYTVTLHNGDGPRDTYKVSVAYGEMMPLPYGSNSVPGCIGCEFVGYFSEENGGGEQYYSKELLTMPHYEWDVSYYEGLLPIKEWDRHCDGDLYAYFTPLTCEYYSENVIENEGYLAPTKYMLTYGTEVKLKAETFSGYTFSYFNVYGKHYTKSTLTLEADDVILKRSDADGQVYPVYWFFAVYTKNCVAEGTQITLADGSQKSVECLTGDETLLVWNLHTGTFDTAPILFIDSDPPGIYEVINLYFSDDTQVKVISEHAFWDFNLNKYVYLDNNASEYIGHWFNKQITDDSGGFSWTKVQLVDVVVKEEYTTAWSPVTYGHLCYYVDGMLSMPGGISGLFNIFEVDSETLKINEELMQNDIETYGLYTYDEFAEIYPVTEEVFEAFGGQYLKISIGKGLISLEQIGELINHYAEFLS